MNLPDTYTAYSYGYPHKSAYGPLRPAVPLGDVWAQEDQRRLFLYVHLPFCEMRCGFCNLFTESQPADDAVDAYLTALESQSHVLRELLPDARFARLALGGGTPTYLTAFQLERLITLCSEVWNIQASGIPTSVETSPATATEDRLKLLADWGVRRISLGVQSFREEEVRGMGRPQDPRAVIETIERIQRHDFPVLNLDLIYGEPGQTVDTWLESIDQALAFQPAELFLYPLYIRPQTGLSRVGESPSDNRLTLYQEGRDRLLSAGYRQVSMRCFRRGDLVDNEGPAYCCQSDGMLGLGCGARSYTRRLHYASRFAVSQSHVRAIVRDWSRQPTVAHAFADHGFWLNADEQRRRGLILSLLQVDGVDRREYTASFGVDPLEAFPQLADLIDEGMASATADHVTLSASGLERSDAIGPWLYSEQTARALAEFNPP